jgi:hypothetical protein
MRRAAQGRSHPGQSRYHADKCSTASPNSSRDIGSRRYRCTVKYPPEGLLIPPTVAMTERSPSGVPAGIFTLI